MKTIKTQEELFDYMGFGKPTTAKTTNEPSDYEISEAYIKVAEENLDE